LELLLDGLVSECVLAAEEDAKVANCVTADVSSTAKGQLA
jgi:hypothetical protein